MWLPRNFVVLVLIVVAGICEFLAYSFGECALWLYNRVAVPLLELADRLLHGGEE